jgi:antitoxin YefM
MIAANYTEFRTRLKELLDTVEEDNEMVVVKRGKGKGSVLISLEEYNSLMETMHLLSSKANALNLFASLEELNAGNGQERDLIED